MMFTRLMFAFFISLGLPAGPVMAQATVDVAEVAEFEQAARALKEQQQRELARQRFSGRGPQLAELFLTRTDAPPGNVCTSPPLSRCRIPRRRCA